MKEAPDFLLIDGNRFRTRLDIPFSCIIKGDGKFQSIAAASILAKVFRDTLMASLAKEFPIYQWEKMPVIRLKPIVRASQRLE
ncbi:ribonuclease HII [Nitritalea halalkaliphila LW7]|uniref:Ribonuclease n=1 Tax=Nitritalea halalkaliphila LW7 TaxID=1189621 RepID=I5C929_9BACT|nr:ribonuclease HII [Nitritalea halalkaliphila LW7]